MAGEIHSVVYREDDKEMQGMKDAIVRIYGVSDENARRITASILDIVGILHEQPLDIGGIVRQMIMSKGERHGQ